MKLHHARRLIGLAGLGSLLATSALAQDSYYYGGVSAGESRGRFDEQRITNSVIGGGVATTGIARDSKDTAYRLFGGYQMNRHFGLELGYFDLGKFGFSSSTTPAGRLDGQIRFQGGSLDLVGALPFGDSWSALARVGGFYAKTRDQFDGSGAVTVTNRSPSKREANVKVGLGMQYALGRSLLLRGEAERYRVSDAVDGHGHINVYSVGLVMPFGGGGSSTPRAMSAPAFQPPVAMASTPAPMPAPTPMPEHVAAPTPTR